MSTHAPTDAEDSDAGDSAATDSYYAALEVAEDAMVIYDRRNHQSWVQSDQAVALEEMA